MISPEIGGIHRRSLSAFKRSRQMVDERRLRQRRLSRRVTRHGRAHAGPTLISADQTITSSAAHSAANAVRRPTRTIIEFQNSKWRSVRRFDELRDRLPPRSSSATPTTPQSQDLPQKRESLQTPLPRVAKIVRLRDNDAPDHSFVYEFSNNRSRSSLRADYPLLLRAQ